MVDAPRSSGVLFEGPIVARVVRVGSLGVSSRSDAFEQVRLRLASRQGVLVLELTREDDLTFLMTMKVSEKEFEEIKTEQNLLVEFASFGEKFVELLKQGFTCVLDLTGLPTLRVVEANQFRQLTHLALRFQPATDEQLKVHLSTRLKEELSRAKGLTEQLSSKEALLAQVEEKLSSSESQVAQLRQERATAEDRLCASHAKELAKQREESVRLLAQTQTASAEQAERQKQQSDARSAALENKLVALSSENRDLVESRAALESECKQLRTRLEVSDKFAQGSAAEVAQLRASNRELDNAKFDLEKKVSELQLQVATTRQQLLDREEALQRSHAASEDSAQRRQAAEEKAQHYKNSTLKLQKKLELGVREINKGNSVIESLQAELREAQERIKTKNLVIRQQEKVVNETKQALEEAEGKGAKLKEELERERGSGKDLRVALEQCRAKLEECNKTLESDQNIIAFLNKQINSQSGGQGLAAGGSRGLLPATYSPPFDEAQFSPPYQRSSRFFTDFENVHRDANVRHEPLLEAAEPVSGKMK